MSTATDSGEAATARLMPAEYPSFVDRTTHTAGAACRLSSTSSVRSVDPLSTTVTAYDSSPIAAGTLSSRASITEALLNVTMTAATSTPT